MYNLICYIAVHLKAILAQSLTDKLPSYVINLFMDYICRSRLHFSCLYSILVYHLVNHLY